MSSDLSAAIDAWQTHVAGVYRAQRPRSESLHKRARRVMPGGDTRYSLALDPFPTYFSRGAGSWLWDVDGNRTLDLVNQATAHIHGHAHPAITEAVRRRVADGTSWSGSNPEQVELAERLADRVPSVEVSRFTNSGTEAVAMMVKVARAATGRDLIIKMDATYHGSADFLEFGPDPGDHEHAVPYTAGVPANLDRNLVIGRFNDTEGVLELIERHRDRLAAVLLTPVLSVGFVEPAPGFLGAIREATAVHGALLLFDEVITLRLARGGAQERYGVVPDLTAMGKIIGGGFPVGAFGGRAELMAVTDPEGDLRVAHAGTFNGNPVTATAGSVSLDLLTPSAFDRLDAAGERLRAGLRAIIRRQELPFEVTGVGSLVGIQPSHIEGDPEWADVSARIMRTLRIAWLADGLHALGIAATTVMDDEEIDAALAIAERVFRSLREAVPLPAPDRAATAA